MGLDGSCLSETFVCAVRFGMLATPRLSSSCILRIFSASIYSLVSSGPDSPEAGACAALAPSPLVGDSGPPVAREALKEATMERVD